MRKFNGNTGHKKIECENGTQEPPGRKEVQNATKIIQWKKKSDIGVFLHQFPSSAV
jgi:hypothetical protein